MLSFILFPLLRVTPDGETQFAGWARMALVINEFSIVEVRVTRIIMVKLLFYLQIKGW